MSKILIPSQSADDWKHLLADEKQWRTGYSARSLAHAWQDANGFPPEIATLLATEDTFASMEFLLAIPEHRVTLPGGARASQSDLWILARTDTGLAAITVEGKVGESFGPTVGEWREDESTGKRVRLAFLCERLGTVGEPDKDLRYQLLHRTVSALLEAERYHARHAVMLVHSFSQSDIGYDDYRAFVTWLGGTAEKGRLISISRPHIPTLHLGWAQGDARYLDA